MKTIIRNSDVCQGGGVGHLGQVDVPQVHDLHPGDVVVADEAGRAGHQSLAGGAGGPSSQHCSNSVHLALDIIFGYLTRFH